MAHKSIGHKSKSKSKSNFISHIQDMKFVVVKHCNINTSTTNTWNNTGVNIKAP